VHLERVNRTFRHEMLDADVLESLRQVREKLIAYLRDKFPDKLPKVRAELSQ